MLDPISAFQFTEDRKTRVHTIRHNMLLVFVPAGCVGTSLLVSWCEVRLTVSLLLAYCTNTG
jgi:hypothetical protein